MISATDREGDSLELCGEQGGGRVQILVRATQDRGLRRRQGKRPDQRCLRCQLAGRRPSGLEGCFSVPVRKSVSQWNSWPPHPPPPSERLRQRPPKRTRRPTSHRSASLFPIPARPRRQGLEPTPASLVLTSPPSRSSSLPARTHPPQIRHKQSGKPLSPPAKQSGRQRAPC